jgi:hypothetical protein
VLLIIILIFSGVFVTTNWDYPAWRMVEGHPSIALHTVNIHGQSISFPVSGDQCWDSPLPCAPFPGFGTRLRGDSLQDGFYLIPEAQFCCKSNE